MQMVINLQIETCNFTVQVLLSHDAIGVAVDMDAGTLTFYKTGASQGHPFGDL